MSGQRRISRRQALAMGATATLGAVAGCSGVSEVGSTPTESPTRTPQTQPAPYVFEYDGMEIQPRRIFRIEELTSTEEPRPYAPPEDMQWLVFTVTLRRRGESDDEVRLPRFSQFAWLVGDEAYQAKLNLQHVGEGTFQFYNTDLAEEVKPLERTRFPFPKANSPTTRSALVPIPEEYHYTEGQLAYTMTPDGTYEMKWTELEKIYEEIP